LEITRLSSKIIRKIETLQSLEPALKRDFVVEGVKYDCQYLFDKNRKLRRKILAEEPNLVHSKEMNQVLQQNGVVGPHSADYDE